MSKRSVHWTLTVLGVAFASALFTDAAAAKPAKPKALVARGQIVKVIDPATVEVKLGRAGRSAGLHTRERVRLIGVAPPRSGRCGYEEALNYTMVYAFDDKARDSNGDTLADRAPANAARVGALVDIRTDPKIKGLRDSAGRLRAYVDAGDTGEDLGRELLAFGLADYRYGEWTRSTRLTNAVESASAASEGAWLFCHADFDRTTPERFDGFTPCPQTFNVDGTLMEEGSSGFVRYVIVSGGTCEAAAPIVSGWAAATLSGDTNGDGIPDMALPAGATCSSVPHEEDENPSLEGTCRTASGLTTVFWAAP